MKKALIWNIVCEAQAQISEWTKSIRKNSPKITAYITSNHLKTDHCLFWNFDFIFSFSLYASSMIQLIILTFVSTMFSFFAISVVVFHLLSLVSSLCEFSSRRNVSKYQDYNNLSVLIVNFCIDYQLTYTYKLDIVLMIIKMKSINHLLTLLSLLHFWRKMN